MTYQTHLRAALREFFRLSPGTSQRALARAAGLSPGWVSEFMRGGNVNMSSADAVLQAAGRLAPEGPDAATLHRLIEALAVPADADRGAAA